MTCSGVDGAWAALEDQFGGDHNGGADKARFAVGGHTEVDGDDVKMDVRGRAVR